LSVEDRVVPGEPEERAPALLRALAEMPEGLPYWSLESLEWSNYIFSHNERELLAYLDECESGPTSEDLWDSPSEWRLRQTSREISRSLHRRPMQAALMIRRPVHATDGCGQRRIGGSKPGTCPQWAAGGANWCPQ